jgi:hypothetical protein
MMVSRRVLVVAATFLLAGACDKKPSPSSAPPATGLPPLDEQAAKPSAAGDRPVHEPTGGNPHAGLPAGHPSVPAGAGEPAAGGMEGATPGDIPFDPKSVIAGVLRLDDKTKAKVADGDTIFLVVRSAENPGPPLAVKKLTAGKWPMTFTLDGRDAMVAGTKMTGKVVVQVRIDKDGDAMTKNPGDVTGVSRPLDPPADKVVVTLDTIL